MILVDSSFWIDYFRGNATTSVEMLDSLLGNEPLAIGDLILTEVLQGFGSARDFNRAKKLLTSATPQCKPGLTWNDDGRATRESRHSPFQSWHYQFVGKHAGGGEAQYQVVFEEAHVVRHIFEWVA